MSPHPTAIPASNRKSTGRVESPTGKGYCSTVPADKSHQKETLTVTSDTAAPNVFGGEFTAIPRGIEDKITRLGTLKVLLKLSQNMTYKKQTGVISVKRLCQQTGLDRTTVQRGIRDLTELGVLTLSPRYNREGEQVANRYKLHFVQQGGVDAQGGGVHAQGLCTDAQDVGVHAPEVCTDAAPKRQSSFSEVFPESSSRKEITHLAVRVGREDDWSGPVIGQDPDTPPPAKPKRKNYNDTNTGLIDFFRDNVGVEMGRYGGANRPALGKLIKRMLADGRTPAEIRTSMLLCNDELKTKPLTVIPWSYYLGNIDRLLVRAEKVGTGTVATASEPGTVSATTQDFLKHLEELKDMQP